MDTMSEGISGSERTKPAAGNIALLHKAASTHRGWFDIAPHTLGANSQWNDRICMAFVGELRAGP